MNRESLYNLPIEGVADMNMRAHPGGGNEMVEVASGEGLVEDLYETQLRSLYIAYHEPLGRLAGLAGKLEAMGAVKASNQVDNIIYSLCVLNTGFTKQADDASLIQVHKTIIRYIVETLPLLQDSVLESTFNMPSGLKESVGIGMRTLVELRKALDVVPIDYAAWEKTISEKLNPILEATGLNSYKEIRRNIEYIIFSLRNLESQAKPATPISITAPVSNIKQPDANNKVEELAALAKQLDGRIDALQALGEQMSEISQNNPALEQKINAIFSNKTNVAQISYFINTLYPAVQKGMNPKLLGQFEKQLYDVSGVLDRMEAELGKQ